MPLKCCVRGCPGKRNSPTNTITSVHKFPLTKPELTRKWLDRLDLIAEPSTTTRVCNLHFNTICFKYTETSTKLHHDAVPLEYKENGLKVLQSSTIPTTINYSLKSESQSETETDETRIEDFESFVNFLDSGSSKKLRKDWNIYEQPDGICFYRLTRDEFFYNIQISFKILVNRDMRVLLFRCDNEADPKELDWILRDSKLELWTQLHKLLEHYRSEPMIMEKSNSIRIIKQALELLKNLKKSPEIDNRVDSIIKLLVETLDQIEPIISFASVKLEPEEYTVEFYAGQEFKDENTIDDILNEHKLEAELEDYKKTVPGNKCETSLSKVLVKTKATKNLSVHLGILPAPKKRQDVIKKEKNVKIEFLLDCQLCDRKQMTKDQLRYHGYSKHAGPFWCDRCGKKYPSRRSLIVHMSRHEGIEKIKCPHCDVMLIPESLRRHIKTRHLGFKPYLCSICGKGFTVRANAAIHEKRHFGPVTPNRPGTSNRSGTPTESKAYVKSGKNAYECPKCHMDFERGGKVFANHVARCIGVMIEKKVSYRYPCFLCEKKFCTKISAAEHMATKHNHVIESVEKMCFECKVEVEDPMAHAKMHNCLFGCTHCGYRFNTQRKLDNHLRERHDDSSRPFTCDLCSISFKTTNHLRSHMATMHTAAEDKKFVCKICSRRYPFKYQLNTHIKASHSDVRRYSCNFCDRRFKKIEAMKLHCLRDHGEPNAYPCPECSEKAKTLNELKNHRLEFHGVSMNVQKYHEA